MSVIANAPWALIVIGAAVFAIAFFVARAVAHRGLLPDLPNARSSHDRVTPRSGGMAIASAWSLGAFFYVWAAPSAGLMVFPLVFITLLVFIVGLMDDKYGLSALAKFAMQFGAAALFLYFVGPLAVGPTPLLGLAPLGMLGAALTTLWIVGFMNAYNFMDGVNGIAAACGGFALAALAAASAFAGAEDVAAAAGFLSLALFGFLPVNFPSGRIFMGDNGSQPVGFLAAALAVIAAIKTDAKVGALFLPTALAPFLFDVMFTVAHRALRGRNVVAAHREHLYQLLNRLGAGHARVTAIYLAATALSSAFAFASLQLAPAWQFAPLAALYLLFLWPALALYRRARAKGLFADKRTPKTIAADHALGDLHPPHAQAAE